MARVETFEDLRVWQCSIALVKAVYVLSNSGQLKRDFGLRDQLRRAAVSIPTNIAEGFERASTKQYIYFLRISKGSAGEVRSLLRVALEIGYVDQAAYGSLHHQVLQISRMLAKQIKSLQ
ncbi:MAG: four helix bundle protein [Cyanobacteria bacterium P01_C01_bin.120]